MRKYVLAGLVAVALLGVSWLVYNRYIQAKDETVPVVAQVMPSQEEQQLEAALNSGDRNQQSSVLTPQLAEAYSGSDQNMLPDGTTLDIKPDTMSVAGNGAKVQAEAVEDGNIVATFTLYLTQSSPDDPWLIYYTERGE